MKDINKLNIDDINVKRSLAGLPALKVVYCYICGEKNAHWPWNCDKLRCKICQEKHFTKYCNYIADYCQWCGGNHLSDECNDNAGRILKAGCYRRCYKCGRKGHIAYFCYASSRRRGYKRKVGFRYRWKKMRKRWRKLKFY